MPQVDIFAFSLGTESPMTDGLHIAPGREEYARDMGSGDDSQGPQVVPEGVIGLERRAIAIAEAWSRAPRVIRGAVERLLGLG